MKEQDNKQVVPNLEELRQARVPSKLKRELRRKYDKRHAGTTKTY